MIWDASTPLLGNANGGLESVANLAADEYIESIDTLYGFKLGQPTFFSHKNKTPGGYGNAVTSQNKTLVKHDGRGLASIQITHWGGATPTGYEGLIFGFTPLLSSWA